MQTLLQSNQWNYGQYFMHISLHPFNKIINQVFEYLAYLLSYAHFILSIFPLISLCITILRGHKGAVNCSDMTFTKNEKPSLRGVTLL